MLLYKQKRKNVMKALAAELVKRLATVENIPKGLQLAQKELAEYSPDEIVGRSEPEPVLGMISRTFGAAEIEALAAPFGKARLRQSDREPPTGLRRILLALGVGRTRGWKGDLSIQFKGSVS